MAITVGQLANLVGGIVRGDANLIVQMPRTLHEAQPGDITFLDNPKHYAKLERSAAGAAVVPPNMPPIARTVIEVADPLMAFVSIVQFFKGKPPRPSGIDSHACIHATAVLGADVAVGPFASIGEHAVLGARCQMHAGVRVGANCKLGDDVVLHPNVVLYEDTVLGNRVVIHANTSIGGDGFGYRFQQGRHVKVPQLGNVVIGDDVEIGAGSTIDRGTFGSTIIGAGTKIDNLVQVAHNVRIGKHNILAALVGVGGSCTTGDYVMMGGQSGVKDHIHIGAGARIGAKAGIIADVPAGQGMFLYPAYEEREAARILACMTRLPGMRKDLLRVLKHLKMDKHSEATTRDPEAPAA